MSSSGITPPPMGAVADAVLPHQVEEAGHEGHVAPRTGGSRRRRRRLPGRGGHDLLRRSVQAGVDHLHPGVPQSPGNHLITPRSWPSRPTLATRTADRTLPLGDRRHMALLLSWSDQTTIGPESPTTGRPSRGQDGGAGVGVGRVGGTLTRYGTPASNARRRAGPSSAGLRGPARRRRRGPRPPRRSGTRAAGRRPRRSRRGPASGASPGPRCRCCPRHHHRQVVADQRVHVHEREPGRAVAQQDARPGGRAGPAGRRWRSPGRCRGSRTAPGRARCPA